MTALKLNTGIGIEADLDTLEFIYPKEAQGPETEKRTLDSIRRSLSDPNAQGPEIVYSVAMDVARKEDIEDLKDRNLLYGAMIFQAGSVGDEPVRSQGHIHAISPSCNASTCEVYEIWSGKACIYMQETAEDESGKCYAVFAKPGDVVIVPPGWAHCTINAGMKEPMLFGAWCVRDYGFDYQGVRSHGGVAFFPKVDADGENIHFEANPAYRNQKLEILNARQYPEFGLEKGVPIYTQYQKNKDLFRFVTNPEIAADVWKEYRP